MKLHPSPTSRNPGDVDRWIRNRRSLNASDLTHDQFMEVVEGDWNVTCKLMYPPFYIAQRFKPEFESSPHFKNQDDAWDWIRTRLLE